MAPISLKKGKVDKLASGLITQTLQINNKDPNFKIAMDYIMSNFRFHRFLDVNPLDVSRSLTGLCSKFRVNSQDKKAEYLEAKVEQFVNLPLLESDENQIQTDAHYALLSFLMTLSNNPLNSDFEPVKKKKISQEEKTFDWSKYLLFGEQKLSLGIDIDQDVEQELYDSDNEVWILSEDDDEEEKDEESDAEINKDSTISGFRKDLSIIEMDNRMEQKEWIKKNIVPAYWKEEEQDELSSHFKHNIHSTSMLSSWETYSKQVGIPIGEYHLFTERLIVKETLWMLSGCTNLHVYHFKEEKFNVNQKIAITHLTKGTLSKYLENFTEVGTRVALLRNFCQQCALNHYDVPKTLQAFGYSISKFLMEIREKLSSIEKILMKNEEEMTLVSLKSELKEEISKVNLIYHIYKNAVLIGNQKCYTVTERVIYFLDVFYDFLCSLDCMGDASTEKMVIILPMFLDICHPYLEDVERWMTTGLLPKHEEFMIYRTQKEMKEETGYWYQTFLIKENKCSDGSLSKLVPNFIKDVEKQILASGKSLGLLEEFVKFTSSVLESDTIHKEVQRCLFKQLEESQKIYTKGDDRIDGRVELDGPSHYINDDNVDPLLRENFKVMFYDIYQRWKSKKPSGYQRENVMNRLNDLLRDSSCRPPMKVLIHQSLFPAILKRYEKACTVLLKLFKKELNFFSHLAVMKNFFLMQEAGAMYDFYTEIFEKAKKKGVWQDMSYLNIVLQDALQTIHPELLESLTVEYTPPKGATSNAHIFDRLSLHYKVPWPVSIILDSGAEQKYNEIFKFLLKVKRAIWVLEQMRFQELAANDKGDNEKDKGDKNKGDNETGTKEDQDTIETRMLVIRMRMLHVIRNFHFYLMTRIEDSVNKDLVIQLDSACDLDEIMERHRKFLYSLKQRCFLHEKVRRTKEAFLRILNLVFDLEELWCKGVFFINLSQLLNLEKEFNRCTSFLQSFFTTLAKRGSYPHFEFLAAAMKMDGGI